MDPSQADENAFHSILTVSQVRICHAGPDKPAPYLAQGHPDQIEKTGFRVSQEMTQGASA
jgi:hypothetical protein